MTYRVGIVGGGNISQTHALAAAQINGVELAAVYGSNPETVRGFVRQYGGTMYDSLEELLGHPDLDIVLLGTPSGLHGDQARAAARRGLHVLSEKPLDIQLDKVDALIEDCEQAGVKLGVFFKTALPLTSDGFKELIDDGGLGAPILMDATVKWYRPPEYYTGSRWRGTWELDGGGALMNQGVHTVDLLLWLFGDVSRVCSQTRTALHDIEVEDTAVAALNFANGAVGTLVATTSAFPGYPRRMELTGSKGTVIVEDDRVTAADLIELRGRPPTGIAGTDNPSSVSPTVSDVSGHRRVLEDFLHAIATDGEPNCSGPEARRSIALITAIYESVRKGMPVEIAAP